MTSRIGGQRSDCFVRVRTFPVSTLHLVHDAPGVIRTRVVRKHEFVVRHLLLPVGE